MKVWTLTVPVRFERIGRLMAYIDEGDWGYIFNKVEKLRGVCLNKTKKNEFDGDFIFTLEISDESQDKAKDRIQAYLRRGIKVRKFGPWTILWDEIRLIDEGASASRNNRPKPLARDEIDEEHLAKITQILQGLADRNGWYLSDWSFEMVCSCGEVLIRLLRYPAGDKYISIILGDNKQTVMLNRATKDLKQACRWVLKEPPAQNSH